MALSKAQWLSKLKTWFPSWYFESEDNQTAHLTGLAELLAKIQESAEGHIDETFILKASGGFLDLHGSERSKSRLPGESDDLYSRRVQKLVSEVDPISIKELVDSLLIAGECEIREHFDVELYFNRDVFLNRNEIFTSGTYNQFTVIIPEQIPPPRSFFNRDYFLDRDAFLAREKSSPEFFETVFKTLMENFLWGTKFTLIEEG